MNTPHLHFTSQSGLDRCDRPAGHPGSHGAAHHTGRSSWRDTPRYYEPHCATRDASGVCTICNLVDNTLHGVIDTEGDAR